MPNWEPDPVRLPARTYLHVGVIALAFLLLGLLVLWAN